MANNRNHSRIRDQIARRLLRHLRVAAIVISHQFDAPAKHAASAIDLTHRQASRIDRIITNVTEAALEGRHQANLDDRRLSSRRTTAASSRAIKIKARRGRDRARITNKAGKDKRAISIHICRNKESSPD